MTEEVRYYILSEDLTGKDFARAVRQHWSIENNCHWQLDVLFHEDASRVRERTLTNNLSWMRRVAISLLKHHPSTDSLKGKRQSAGWNDHFLAQVLQIQQSNFAPPLYESQFTTADGLRLLSEFQLCGRTSQHGRLHVALLIFNSAMPP